MSRRQFQENIDKTVDLETELRNIESQIQQLEVSYLERTWNEGNILIGWNNSIHTASSPHNPSVKIKLTPKDRAFSLSSMTSRAHYNLEENVDRQINALVEMRFSTNARKKYRKKKKRTRAPLVLRNRRIQD